MLQKIASLTQLQLEFSPAEILSFLLEYRLSPREAGGNVEARVTRIREEGEE
jgi:hypothetical protein